MTLQYKRQSVHAAVREMTALYLSRDSYETRKEIFGQNVQFINLREGNILKC